MAAPRITKIHLTAFKSFRGETMPLDDATVLTGRNSSGKSNALDAIEVLGRLATGEDIGDALDGRRREGGAVRGGSQGCAPHGSDFFELGCTVDSRGTNFTYQVKIQVQPHLQVLSETLEGFAPAAQSGAMAWRTLVSTRYSSGSGVGLEAEIFNGRKGPNPIRSFRDSRLIITQMPVQFSARGTRADRAVLQAIDAVLTALKGSFQLDPIPHLMRDYVPERDSELRRSGENLSAALAKMRERDTSTFQRLVDLVRKVADERIQDIDVTRSSLGDVMMALQESRSSEGPEITPAREMSDGLLRFTAIATALLTPTVELDLDAPTLRGSEEGDESVLLVIEELENGLHPSQAKTVLGLVLEASRRPGTNVLLTTHSPALLDAVEGSLLKSVLVCFRDEVTGLSRISRMTEIAGYAEALAQGSLGDSVSRGLLTSPDVRKRDYSDFKKLLGIS